MKREGGWAIVVLVIILLAYFLPYTVFRGTDAWYGSFLVWTLTGLIIIPVNFFITRKWGD